jgi:hypothetical protein
MPVLDTLADRQAEWSATANELKRTIDHARTMVFALSISGAVLAAIASQMNDPAPGVSLADNHRAWVAILAALCLAVGTFFSQRLLGAGQVTAWVRARALSEALKREAYKFATGAAPYNDPDAAKNEALLDQQRGTIERDGDDLEDQLASASGPGSAPRASLTLDEYRTARVIGQAKGYYRPAAKKYRQAARRLRQLEFSLALLATIFTAVAGVAGKSAPIFGIELDFAAFTAVLTTIGGAILAHVEASRYDFLAMTYTATARRLEDRANQPVVSPSDFVNDCETVIASENASWMAKWSK